MFNDTLTEQVIAAAIKVHSALGAGCLESTYHACLEYQFRADGFASNISFSTALSSTINFNVPHLRQGLRRVVNNYRENA